MKDIEITKCGKTFQQFSRKIAFFSFFGASQKSGFSKVDKRNNYKLKNKIIFEKKAKEKIDAGAFNFLPRRKRSSLGLRDVLLGEGVK
jgi:hypothetical protein